MVAWGGSQEGAGAAVVVGRVDGAYGRSVEGGDFSPGLLDQKRSGGDIPEFAGDRDGPDQGAAGDIGQVQRGRAEAAGAALGRDGPDALVGQRMGDAFNGKEGEFVEFIVVDSDAGGVKLGVTVLHGGEHRVVGRVEDDGDNRPAFIKGGNADRKTQKSVRVVVRAVDGIDDPPDRLVAAGAI